MSNAISPTSLFSLVLKNCGHCNTTDVKLSRCASCNFERYCRFECQKQDWKKHKVICKTPDEVWESIYAKTFVSENEKREIEKWNQWYKEHFDHDKGVLPDSPEDLIPSLLAEAAPLNLDISEPNPNLRMLDLGAGKGEISQGLFHSGWGVTVVDFAEVLDFFVSPLLTERFEKERGKYNEPLIVKKNVLDYPFPKEHYDLVVAKELLPYLDPKHLQKFLQIIQRSLKPEGHFYGTFSLSQSQVSVPMAWHLDDQVEGEQMLHTSGFTIKQISSENGSVEFLVKKRSCSLFRPLDPGRLPPYEAMECRTCHKTAVRLNKCSKCHFEKYCSQECQKRDWQHHKKICLLYGKGKEVWKEIVAKPWKWGSNKMNPTPSGDHFGYFRTPEQYWNHYASMDPQPQAWNPGFFIPFFTTDEAMNDPLNRQALELGPGWGEISTFLATEGWEITAVELSVRAVEKFQDQIEQLFTTTGKNIQNLIKIKQKNVENYSFLGARFDLLVARDFFLATDPAKMPILMQNIYKTLKPGGVLYGRVYVLPASDTAAKNAVREQSSYEVGYWYIDSADSARTLLLTSGFDLVQERHQGMHFEFFAKKRVGFFT